MIDMREVFEFANKAHAGQVRKSSGDPYINHPVRVSLMAITYGLSPINIAAALLHDVVEDTDVSLDEITERFGKSVASAVWGLTNYEARSGGPDDTMNRADRKAADRRWLSAQEPGVKSLKFLDMIDNILDQPSTDSFMDVMLDEMSLLARAMDVPDLHGVSVHSSLIVKFWDVYYVARAERERSR